MVCWFIHYFIPRPASRMLYRVLQLDPTPLPFPQSKLLSAASLNPENRYKWIYMYIKWGLSFTKETSKISKEGNSYRNKWKILTLAKAHWPMSPAKEFQSPAPPEPELVMQWLPVWTQEARVMSSFSSSSLAWQERSIVSHSSEVLT